MTITLYYRAFIHTSRLEINITLFRNTDRNNDFVPDFPFMTTKVDADTADYVLLDFKYSTRKTILSLRIFMPNFRYQWAADSIKNGDEIAFYTSLNFS